jgi:hypothetical protein
MSIQIVVQIVVQIYDNGNSIDNSCQQISWIIEITLIEIVVKQIINSLSIKRNLIIISN